MTPVLFKTMVTVAFEPSGIGPASLTHMPAPVSVNTGQGVDASAVRCVIEVNTMIAAVTAIAANAARTSSCGIRPSNLARKVTSGYWCLISSTGNFGGAYAMIRRVAGCVKRASRRVSLILDDT